MTIISATLRLQALLLCCLVADLYGIATQQHFRKKRSNEQGLHFTSSCKEQRQQTEEDREQDRVISWHDDSLLNTCYFLLIYCLLTAEVDFKSCLWTQDKQIFPLKDSFFFPTLAWLRAVWLWCLCAKKKLKLNEFQPFFLSFFSVLSFIFLETSSYQSDILCPEKYVYLWPGICTEKKNVNGQVRQNIFCQIFKSQEKTCCVHVTANKNY